MAMTRLVEAEWLDVLPSSDPRSRRSRRDLGRINAFMGNDRIVARTLRHLFNETPRRIAELGAGDGHFLVKLAQQLHPVWRDVQVTLVDRQDIVSASTLSQLSSLNWHAEACVADVLEWLRDTRERRFDFVLANLFVHHFNACELRRLLHLLRLRTRVFLACEPRRARAPLAASRLLALIGCNEVSRHDAAVSVRAGFDGTELSALWGARAAWSLQEEPRGLFSHVFIASRNDMALAP